jgi:hypothetical protein
VQERYTRAPDPHPRAVIDRLQARGYAGVKRVLHGRHSIRDVVQPWTPAAEELAYGCIRAERLQKLHVSVADPEQRRVDALLGDSFAVHELHPEGVTVQRQGFVDAGDGYADMVDRRQHRV